MKCNKCGFVSFDYLTECKKCGIDLTVIRDGLGHSPFRPNVPLLLASILKGYDPSREEHEEHLENELVGESSDSGATEIEFGDDLNFSEAPESEESTEILEGSRETLEPPSQTSLSESRESEVLEIASDEVPEPELSINLTDEISEPIVSEASPADSPEMNMDMELKLELADAPEDGEKTLRLEQALDPGDLDEIGLESPVVQKKNMEIGDEDLLELILEDDDLLFTLENDEQTDAPPGAENVDERTSRKAKGDIPSIEDINDFVLGLMGESAKKK